MRVDVLRLLHCHFACKEKTDYSINKIFTQLIEIKTRAVAKIGLKLNSLSTSFAE